MFTDQESSFPIVTSNTISHFSNPPSPWRVASLVYPDYNLDEDNGRGDGFSRKSFSYLESKMKREILDAAAASPDQSEEKMDMLWEDFNEELQRVSSMNRNKEVERLSRSGATKKMQAFFSLKMPKTSKRPNVVVVMKIMLKKLILLRMRKLTSN